MGRPTTKRRLHDVDPEAFGRDVADRVAAHLKKLLGTQDDDIARLITQHVHDIAEEASLLANFARDAKAAPLTTRSRKKSAKHTLERASIALLAVRVWLYSCAAHSETAVETIATFPSDDIGLVLLAAHARVRLGHGEAVPVRELACLAGVDPDHVRLLARQGEIPIMGGAVAPRAARQWLEERGIALS